MCCQMDSVEKIHPFKLNNAKGVILPLNRKHCFLIAHREASEALLPGRNPFRWMQGNRYAVDRSAFLIAYA